MPNDEHFMKASNAYEEIKSRQAYIIKITNNKNKSISQVNDIVIPENSTFSSLLSIIPIQFLSYELAITKGYNPDMPRNLAKVVTVE